MSEFKKALKNIGGENVDIENNISPLAIQNYDVKKLDINLSNSEVAAFNMFDTDNVIQIMKNIEIKAIIHGFYQNQQVEFDVDNVEGDCRRFMWKLQLELANKDENEGLGDMETILFFILLKDGSKQYEHAYSDHLVNEFKNVLEEVV